jgi:hypothetical protein
MAGIFAALIGAVLRGKMCKNEECRHNHASKKAVLSARIPNRDAMRGANGRAPLVLMETDEKQAKVHLLKLWRHLEH